MPTDVSTTSAWKSIVLTAMLVPAIFWLRFGRIDGFAIGFTVFLIMVLSAVRFLPALSGKYKSETPKNIAPSWFDRLGVVWLLSIPFAPFLAWVISEFFTITAANWQTILGIKAVLCVVLPSVCVLPLTRYLNGKTALVAALILIIGTCFPVIIGWNSMLDLIKGAQEREVFVSDVRRIMYTRNFKETPTDIIVITLDNGKVYQANIKFVSVEPGSATLIILPNVEIVLASK